jgi:hypothetical protein
MSRGATVNPNHLENVYVVALAKIDPALAETKRKTPIFQRNSLAAKKDAIRDAAAALGALWMTKGAKTAGATSR